MKPFLGEFPAPADLFTKLAQYLELLLVWNRRTNLTALREPEQIITRHFGESLFAAQLLAPKLESGAMVLDFGSGAGFPGVPLGLLLPEVRVILGESQNKKATFLREVVRTLGLSNVQVHAGRVESLPAATLFEAVTMRAVDDPELAATEAAKRVAPGGWLVSLQGGEEAEGMVAIPGSERRFVRLEQR
ncbi:MAG: 16S rRNA (guanine(527)-N(7))-methyltransferase RsmG [Acidobacteriaceae bacterium]|nr:16S rRNA (guanine(527)-N(7))-methyltransferase RsmG [Acidobacteriaceae bacterium]